MDSRHGSSTRSIHDDEDVVVSRRSKQGLEAPRSEEDPLVAVRRHRETVVLRLLDRGLSTELLIRLLPEWQPMICSVAERVATGQTAPAHGSNGSGPRP